MSTPEQYQRAGEQVQRLAMKAEAATDWGMALRAYHAPECVGEVCACEIGRLGDLLTQRDAENRDLRSQLEATVKGYELLQHIAEVRRDRLEHAEARANAAEALADEHAKALRVLVVRYMRANPNVNTTTARQRALSVKDAAWLRRFDAARRRGSGTISREMLPDSIFATAVYRDAQGKEFSVPLEVAGEQITGQDDALAQPPQGEGVSDAS